MQRHGLLNDQSVVLDLQDGGDKEMCEAIEVSNNVYHAQLIGQLDPAPVVTMAQRLGIPDRDLPEECSLALGTATVLPVDMVRAFATFANEGHRCDPFAIGRIEQGDDVLLEHETDCEEAVDEDLALRMTELLIPPVESRTATAAQPDRPVAGKTGTTDDFRDAWFVGYVPQLVTAAWVGYEQQDPMDDIRGLDGVMGGSLPADIWVSHMQAVVEDYRDEGTVLEQEPSPATEVARGHFLRLQVSDGTGDPPSVPDVVESDEEEATDALLDAEYEVEVVQDEVEVTLQPDEEADELDPRDGEVIEQDPSGGTPLEPGETVTITVVRYDVEEEEEEEEEGQDDETTEDPEEPDETAETDGSEEG